MDDRAQAAAGRPPGKTQVGAQAGTRGRTQAPLRLGRTEFAPGRLLVMAIVNRTPDSFYRPGLTWDEGAALERVHTVVAEGADIIDIGGVPAKPGAEFPSMRRSGGPFPSSRRSARLTPM